MMYRRVSLRMVLVLLCILMGTTIQSAIASDDSPEVPATRRSLMRGYLPFTALPNIAKLIPPPPAEGSAAMAHDAEVSKKNLALRGTPRWDLAAQDADLTFPQAMGTFSCALNAPITEADTPRLYHLLRKVTTDAAFATVQAKNKYKRPRPFLVNKKPVCTPESEGGLSQNGSYPSGHTSIGWTWALILAEVDPENIDAILARGRAFGQSRVVCNVHWQSDVNEGRFTAAAVVARLHGDPKFLADIEAAKAEIKAIRSKGLPTMRDCKAEAEMMSY